jgi:maltooligosyltrehalose trehalohydrolase
MERPDPASRFQPQGVHGPSQVIDPFFPWADQGWSGQRLHDYIIYELHVGTFTPEGTFEATTDRLDALKDLGVTAVEIMPVAQFPGERNWGYDGVYPFAVQNSYEGPEGFKRLVNACHRRELAVVLDVVYNHLGPEGNYLNHYGPYFTDHYRTPWGASLNFDGPHSDEVRRFFIENALYWIQEYHVDALRLDAVHAILDFSAQPFLEELAMVVHEQADRLNRRVYLIAESALNDTRIIRSRDLGGFGLDAQWNDDFHHALHTLLTGEKDGYYQDFGTLSHLQKAFREGFVYSGQYSLYRRCRHGNSSVQIPADHFVVFAQNHDQIGNRMLGERLSQLIPFEGLKLAAGTVLLSPFIALLFMGEEYGETAPFPYFTSHSDSDLVKAVRRGRREEFAPFEWQGDPFDPQDEATFLRAKLNQDLVAHWHHRHLFDFHKELIRLRKELPIITNSDEEQMEVLGYEGERVLLLRRWSDTSEAVSVHHFSENPASVSVFMPQGRWQKRLDSAEERWQGPGSQIPMEIISEGFVTMALSSYAVLLFTRERNA